MLSKIISRLNNKYFITILIFMLWMLFFDNNSLITQIRLSNALNDLEMERDYYHTEIKNDRAATLELITDTLTLEKFGREQYLMKRDNEDIYLIVDEKE